MPSLIALERFLNFDQIMDDVGAQILTQMLLPTALAKWYKVMITPKLAYSIINAYIVYYHIGNKLLVILGIGFSVTQLRILQKRIKEFKSKNWETHTMLVFLDAQKEIVLIDPKTCLGDVILVIKLSMKPWGAS